MDKTRFEKLFSAEEANELIPRLELLVRELQIHAASLRNRVYELALVDERLLAMNIEDAVVRHPELRPLASRMAEIAGEIDEMGCFLKDIDQGLVDFPFLADGPGTDPEDPEGVAFLCWQFGEQSVIAWHPIDDGFSGRRPLPGARKQLLN